MRTLVAWLVWLFPARFRRRFGADLTAAFDDRWREDGGGWRLALRTIVDLLRAAAGEWRSALGLAARPRAGLRSADSDESPVRSATLILKAAPSRMSIGVSMPNLRLAFRTLFKTPFVTVVAVLSLALGIGANAAIFSLFDQMLLRPLPVPAAGRAGQPRRAGAEAGLDSRAANAGDCDEVFSYPMFRDLERQQTAFTRHRRAPLVRRERRVPRTRR